MRAVKRVNLDVATHAVTDGTLINRSIFCRPFFINAPLSFAIVHAAPCRFTEVSFSEIKKLDMLLSRYCCSLKHHKAIPDRLLFSRAAQLFTDALRGSSFTTALFASPSPSSSTIFACDNATQSQPTLSRASFVRRGKYDNPWGAGINRAVSGRIL